MSRHLQNQEYLLTFLPMILNLVGIQKTPYRVLKKYAVILCLLGLSSIAYCRTDELKIFTALMERAERGDAKAQYHIGMMHHNGIGTNKNQLLALKWFRESAKNGMPLAAYKLGCYYSGQAPKVTPLDMDKALQWKIIGANKGYSLAQVDVANMYAQGKGTGQNWQEAVKWWRAAAEQGERKAQLNLAIAYLKGKGVEKDLAKAYLYLALSRTHFPEHAIDGSIKKQLDKIAGEMKPGEINGVLQMHRDWQPKPTPITIYANEGLNSGMKEIGMTEGKDD